MTSELTLDRVQWVDEGIYSCLAKQVESNDEPTKQEIILEIFGKFLFFYFKQEIVCRDSRKGEINWIKVQILVNILSVS